MIDLTHLGGHCDVKSERQLMIHREAFAVTQSVFSQSVSQHSVVMKTWNSFKNDWRLLKKMDDWILDLNSRHWTLDISFPFDKNVVHTSLTCLFSHSTCM